MSLRLLLDENISAVVADQARLHCPEIVIESVFRWRGGAFVSQKDEQIITAAARENWTLVTYDQKTIPLLLRRLFQEGRRHEGVIYVDERTIANHDFGLLIKALIDLWQLQQGLDWQDHVHFLERPTR